MSYVHSDGMGAITSGFSAGASLTTPSRSTASSPSSTSKTRPVVAVPVRPAQPSVKNKYPLPPHVAWPAVKNVTTMVSYLMALVRREQEIRNGVLSITRHLSSWKSKISIVERDLIAAKRELSSARGAFQLSVRKGVTVQKSQMARRVVDLAKQVAALSKKVSSYNASYKALVVVLKLFNDALARAKKDIVVARREVEGLGAPSASLPPPTTPQQQQQDAAAVAVEQQAEAEAAQQTQQVVSAAQETAAAVQEAASSEPALASEATKAAQEVQTATEEATAPASLDAPIEASETPAAAPSEGGFGKIFPWLAVAGIAAVVLMRK